MVNYNINYRWENEIPHNPKSIKLFKQLRKVDTDNGDYFDWRCGGDGDNGEQLMYALDIIFEEDL